MKRVFITEGRTNATELHRRMKDTEARIIEIKRRHGHARPPKIDDEYQRLCNRARELREQLREMSR